MPLQFFGGSFNDQTNAKWSLTTWACQLHNKTDRQTCLQTDRSTRRQTDKNIKQTDAKASSLHKLKEENWRTERNIKTKTDWQSRMQINYNFLLSESIIARIIRQRFNLFTHPCFVFCKLLRLSHILKLSLIYSANCSRRPVWHFGRIANQTERRIRWIFVNSNCFCFCLFQNIVDFNWVENW